MAKSIKLKNNIYLDTSSIVHNHKTLKEIIYPVGSIYLSVNSTNPSTYFGGTWVQLKDRFLIGVGDTYKTVNATGGASTVTLATTNLPSHTHSVGAHAHGLNSHTHTYARSNDNTNSHTLTVNEIPSHKHTIISWRNFAGTTYGEPVNNARAFSNIAVNGDGTSASADNFGGIASAGGGQGHTHGIGRSSQNTGVASGNTANSTAFNSGATGSGTAFSIIPPYLVVYMWKRTA